MTAPLTDFDARSPHAEPPGAARKDGARSWMIWFACGVIDLLLVGGLVWWWWA